MRTSLLSTTLGAALLTVLSVETSAQSTPATAPDFILQIRADAVGALMARSERVPDAFASRRDAAKCVAGDGATDLLLAGFPHRSQLRRDDAKCPRRVRTFAS